MDSNNKTLVIIRLPSGSYVSCNRSRLSELHEGHILVLNGEQIQVEATLESLSSGGNLQLMELLRLEHSDPVEAAQALANIVNLDATPGQIKFGDEPDKVVLVRTRKPGSSGKRSPIRTPGDFRLNLDIKSLLSGGVTAESLLADITGEENQ